MKAICHSFRTIDNLIEPLRKFADKVGAPVLDLGFRLYLALPFIISGKGRLMDFLNGNWDTQIFLFDMEHPVPGLSASLAAPITTVAELILPVLLALGLFGRFAAAGLFAMALMIDITYQHNAEHLLWMALALAIFVRGPGVLSLDHLLVKSLRGGACPVSGGADDAKDEAEGDDDKAKD